MKTFFDELINAIESLELPTVSYKNESIKSLDSATQVELELPGVKKDQISIKVEDGILKIDAELRSKIKISRMYKLSTTSDIQKITSKLEDGILTINIPKKQEEKKKAFEIKIE